MDSNTGKLLQESGVFLSPLFTSDKATSSVLLPLQGFQVQRQIQIRARKTQQPQGGRAQGNQRDLGTTEFAHPQQEKAKGREKGLIVFRFLTGG